MIIKNAKFITSIAKTEDILKTDFPEIAFVGRSNVGKSSLLNKLANQKNLAKTSSMPGRTRLLNYFFVNEKFYFVDLPGYGYAQAGFEHKERWARLLEDYLLTSKQLRLVFVLVDIRHEPTEQDKQMLKFLFYNQIPFEIIATKSDKLSKSKIPEHIQILASKLMVGKGDIVAFSSETGYNSEKILKLINNSLLDEENENNE